MTSSSVRRDMSKSRLMGLGTPFRYQLWHTGAASSMWPIRSRRTFDRVTSTPQRSHLMPLNLTFLYLPQ